MCPPTGSHAHLACSHGPKLGSTLLCSHTVPKCDSIENSSSGSDQEYPGLQIENLKNALERGQVQSSFGMSHPDIQSFYHKLKEIQRNQPEKTKSSFSIDSLAKSSAQTTSPTNQIHHQIPRSNGFTTQHQELYRKALENLHTAQRTLMPPHGINPLMGMRTNPMFQPQPTQPNAQHQATHLLAQQAHMARLQQAQRNSHVSEHRMGSRGSAMKISSSIVREAKNQLKGLDPENMYIECPLCNKRIKRLYHFQRHMRIHSGEKSHQCPYCPYKSVRKDNLKSHLKTHEKHAMEARRNAEILDKKRSSEFEAIRRLQFNAMKKMSSMQQSIKQQMMQQPQPFTQQQDHASCKLDYPMKEEPAATEITEIDSGCESPQEQASPMRVACQSDTSGIESGQSERHSSKESDSSFDSPDGIIDVTE